jgi:hypothetical protein
MMFISEISSLCSAEADSNDINGYVGVQPVRLHPEGWLRGSTAVIIRGGCDW